MQLQRILQTLLLSLTPIAQAAELTINLGSSSLLPNPSTLPASTHATLLSPDGQLYNARLTRTNSLIFKNLSLGSHLLTIYSPAIVYPPFRVDVDNKSEEPSTTQTDPLAPTSSASAADTTGSSLQTIQVYQTFRANEWSNKGPRLGVSNTGQLILTILPSARKEFYQKRGGFNILSFFMSPMILMAVVGLGMVFGMPYLLENMDPEMKAEYEEIRSKGVIGGDAGNAAQQLQNFDIAGWLAGGKSSSTGRHLEGRQR